MGSQAPVLQVSTGLIAEVNIYSIAQVLQTNCQPEIPH